MNISPQALLAAAAWLLASSAAFAVPVLQQDVRVETAQFGKHVFVTGKTGAGSASGTADATQLYWYDHASNLAVGSLGGEAVATVSKVSDLRNIVSATEAAGAIARTSIYAADIEQTSWHIDLGSELLNSNVDGYKVANSSITVIDFGQAGPADMWLDFVIGLWNGTDMMLASAMDQLHFTLTPAPDSGGSVQYLGNNVFRFLETGRGGSGTDMQISAALDGYAVRTMQTEGLHVSDAKPLGDWVDLAANRTLQQIPTVPGGGEVPETPVVALVALGLIGLLWQTRRTVRRADCA